MNYNSANLSYNKYIKKLQKLNESDKKLLDFTEKKNLEKAGILTALKTKSEPLKSKLDEIKLTVDKGLEKAPDNIIKAAMPELAVMNDKIKEIAKIQIEYIEEMLTVFKNLPENIAKELIKYKEIASQMVDADDVDTVDKLVTEQNEVISEIPDSDSINENIQDLKDFNKKASELTKKNNPKNKMVDNIKRNTNEHIKKGRGEDMIVMGLAKKHKKTGNILSLNNAELKKKYRTLDHLKEIHDKVSKHESSVGTGMLENRANIILLSHAAGNTGGMSEYRSLVDKLKSKHVITNTEEKSLLSKW